MHQMQSRKIKNAMTDFLIRENATKELEIERIIKFPLYSHGNFPWKASCVFPILLYLSSLYFRVLYKEIEMLIYKIRVPDNVI